MKEFEMAEAGRKLLPGLPIMIRCDGRSFSSFCKGLKKPFDPRMTELMSNTAKFLCEETNAILAYNQSDEISLVIHNEAQISQVFFDGRIQKLTSVIASLATAYFNRHLSEHLPEKASKMPIFDCRVWNVPTLEEAANCIFWREIDATKNSISMAAQSVYSHKELHGKHSNDKQEMLHQKGINWNDYPASFKRGVYHRRVTKLVKFTTEELEALPAKHEARKNPNLMVERSVVERVEFPPLSKVADKVSVLFKTDNATQKHRQ
jgi:tRNA(His) 5'-end guanylyltransferase